MLNRFLFYIFLLITCSINAQDIKFEHYNDKGGLSQNSVRHIVQDKQGFLWIGTFSGLNRFDGYEFKTYLSNSGDKNSINNNDITALKYDENNNWLWIGTRNGLTQLNLNTYKFTTYLNQPEAANSLPDNEIRSVYIDRFNRVWVGTKDHGLYWFYVEENRFEKVNLPNFNYIKEIFEDNEGNIWIGSYGTASVAKIVLNNNGEIQKTATYTIQNKNTSENNPYLNFIYQDEAANLFVGTRNGVYKLSKSENKFEHLEVRNKELSEALGSYFISVSQAPDGKYWVGTIGGLLVCDKLEDIQEGHFKHYFADLTNYTSLVDNLVTSLFFDASGVLWIGTENGLDKYDPFQNQFYLNKDISKYIGNQVPWIRGFSKTYNNNLIVATRHNGLFVFSDFGFKPLYHGNYDIASIYTINGTVFFCGLWNGKLLVYNYLNSTAKVVDVGFNDTPIVAFERLGNNQLIVGSFGEGAIKINTNNLKPVISGDHLLQTGDINEILLGKNNEVWFATEGGLIKYNLKTKTQEHFLAATDQKSGLPHVNVSDIIFDKNDVLWVATRQGLCYFDKTKNKFVQPEEPAALTENWITDLLVDSNNNLWLNVNNNSVARYNFKANSYNAYRVDSGNRLDYYSPKGFFSKGASNIYLGGKNGVIHFSPEALNINKLAPKPIITEIKVQNEIVIPGKEINGKIPLEKDFNETQILELDYNIRNFSFQFSTPSYTNQLLNQFQYKLNGFDKDWVTTTSNSRTIQYTNLFPGEYQFQLKASNSDGVWSAIKSYQIKINKPFWLTYKALVLFLLLIGLITYFIRREVKNRMRLKQELVTEKVNRERDVKLNNEKLRFFTNISHELRTPLTLILGPAKQLLEDKEINSTSYQKSRFQLIHQNASRLLNLVNQVLDFRKAQTGELKLKVTKTNVIQFTQNTFDSFKEFAYNKNIHFNFNTEIDAISGWLDKDKCDKILYNLLSNAIKFTQKYGHVDLFVGFKNNDKTHLIIEVSDDGIGIPKKSQEKIFNRFYQATNSKENNTGSGIGLSLVKALVDLHKGEISVKSKPKTGSVFTVLLPITRDFYSEDEVFEIEKNEENFVPFNDKTPKNLSTNTEIKQKILVIEDNLELRNYLIDYLSDYYQVFEAENGEEGLQLCRKIKPILCVADVMMPVKDGLEFCKELKNDESISHIPVILLTALSENEDKVRGFDLGADGYLVKPFDPALLKSRISNIVKTRFDLKAKFSGDTDSEISLLVNSPIDEAFMEKLANIIDNNIENPDLTTSYLCDKLGVSSSKLYRKIKALTDLSPNEFIRTVRLKKSAQLLKTKKYNVSEVTNLVGFNDPLYFSRRFKQQFGFPPSQLLK
ncbi:histidine kinase [Tamlana sedimentorum]|uniref:histidine kinase n=1 Tax=Neotamlana sedimentorum TaxID=1435349 RepID=A0A0D7WEY9_9FLAO|nr:hybrid sensor histidine kinase/response regulator transcription factor [Tamlana sedimentorum]KJD37248.1 histidine kinase [Tamlana sedimentorum]